MIDGKMLLSQLKEGNSVAVREWYSLYYQRLLSLVRRKVSVEKDAEELVQDTFLGCLRHLPLFRGESSIWTWMCRISQHEVADYYRKRYAKKVIKSSPLSELLATEGLDTSQEVSHQVALVLHMMSAESREILQMKYIDRKKVKSIAEELGRSVKSIESLLFRARLEFRELYLLEGE